MLGQRRRLLGRAPLILLLLVFLILGGAFAAVAVAAPAQPQLAMGDTFSMLIKADGSLWAWGNNQYGQLGVDDYLSEVPVRVGTGTDWAHVTTGSVFTLAVKTDGTLWAWGQNSYGQLGLGDATDRLVPTQVGTDSDWAAIGAGLRFALAIKTDGSLWAWGQNLHGQLGLGDTTQRDAPTRVGMDTDWAMVDGGGQYTVAIKQDGTLWSWGQNYLYQLGQGDTTERLLPAKVGTDTDWAWVGCSDNDTRALKNTGSLYAWGYNNYGQLGLGDMANRDVPTPVPGSWDLMCVGDDSSLGTLSGGALRAWGDNTYGQLGQNDRDPRSSPTAVGTDTDWIVVGSGHDHVAAVKADGGLWTWGKNGAYQLGLGDTTDRLVPTFGFYLDDTTAPSITSLTSPSHPVETQYYANATPSFSWGTSVDASGVAGYSIQADPSPGTVPGPDFDTTESTWTLSPKADGIWYFHVRAVDHAGNWGPVSHRRVMIDTTAPVTTDDAPATWSKNAVTVHLSATDAGSGVADTQYKLDGGGWTTGTQVTISSDGVHTLAYRSTDSLGTVEADKSCTVKIDATAPVTTDDAPAGWSKNAVTVHLAASDAGSGVATTQYKLDGGGWTTGTQVTISSDGVHTLAYRSTDNLGTVEAEKSATVRIDGVAPVTTDDAPAGWQMDPVTVHLAASDAASGVATTQYKLDGGGWTTGTQVTISSDGVHTLAYRSTDSAGMVEADKSCTVKLDTTAPATADDAPTAWRRAVTVHLAASDAGSGVATTQYNLDGGGWTTGTEVTISSDGVHTLAYRSTDNAGRVEADKSCTVRIDRMRPSTAAPRKASVRRGRYVYLYYKVKDPRPGSATAKVTIRIKTLSGKTMKQVVLKDRTVNKTLRYRFRCTLKKRTYRFIVVARDAAGNAQSSTGRNYLRVR